jgi:hypothetical protein
MGLERMLYQLKKHEGSIPFTRSIDYQGFSQQCSKRIMLFHVRLHSGLSAGPTRSRTPATWMPQ